ncbi:MAG: transketolase, partial [Lentisphaerae bacterium]|nr:transketolase [Lentisphaerota bacterium]
SMPTIKPIDAEMLTTVASPARLIVTIEEHSVIGGLGSAVAEVLAQIPPPRPALRIIGLQSGFSCAVGDQRYLRDLYGLSTEKIVEGIKQSLPR